MIGELAGAKAGNENGAMVVECDEELEFGEAAAAGEFAGVDQGVIAAPPRPSSPPTRERTSRSTRSPRAVAELAAD